MTGAEGRIDRRLQRVEQGLITLDDTALKEPLTAAKAAKERVRLLDRPGNGGGTITAEKITKLSGALRDTRGNPDRGFRKAYLKLFVDQVMVGDDQIRIRVPTVTLAKAASKGGLPATGEVVPSFVLEWRPVRDSNPCYQRESLTAISQTFPEASQLVLKLA